MDVGRRIRDRREKLELTTGQLAKLSGMTVLRVTEIETGQPFGTAELARLAAGLVTEPSNLLSKNAEDPRRSPARFRAPEGIDKLPASDVRLLARGQEAGRVCFELAQMLGRQGTQLHDLRQVKPVQPSPAPWRQGYKLGRAARVALTEDATQPIASIQGLLDLEKIDPAEAEKLKLELTTVDEAGAERWELDLERVAPESVGLEQPPGALARGLLSDVALRACQQGIISRGRAAEILTLS